MANNLLFVSFKACASLRWDKRSYIRIHFVSFILKANWKWWGCVRHGFNLCWKITAKRNKDVTICPALIKYIYRPQPQKRYKVQLQDCFPAPLLSRNPHFSRPTNTQTERNLYATKDINSEGMCSLSAYCLISERLIFLRNGRWISTNKYFRFPFAPGHVQRRYCRVFRLFYHGFCTAYYIIWP